MPGRCSPISSQRAPLSRAPCGARGPLRRARRGGARPGRESPRMSTISLRGSCACRDDVIPTSAALGQQQVQRRLDPLAGFAVDDVRRQGGELVDHQHDCGSPGRRPCGCGRSPEVWPAGRAAPPRRLRGTRRRTTRSRPSSRCRPCPRRLRVVVAVAVAGEEALPGGELHAALGVDHPHLDQPGTDAGPSARTSDHNTCPSRRRSHRSPTRGWPTAADSRPDRPLAAPAEGP